MPMARKPRCRLIDSYPEYWSFCPEENPDRTVPVTLTLDEYEAIRLLDKEGLTQEQCAKQMGVARTTITAIYDSARKKIALCIIDGRRLVISGGQIQLVRRAIPTVQKKGSSTMRIALTYENGQIFQHFGHTAQFKLYDVEDGKIMKEQIIDTQGTGHGALAGFLQQCQADALICGGIGMGAQMALKEAGVKLYAGVSGDADAAAKAFVEGTLAYAEGATCDHHHEHGEGRSCGHHSCGEHGCGK